MQILIIDSDEAFRESLSSLLVDSGHSVVIARDIMEATEQCAPGKCSLLFLDPSSRPEMLGKIKAHNPDIPVVIMSLNPSIESIISVLRQGAFDYLIKPFTDTEQLMVAIARARRSIEAASLQRVYLNRILKTFSDLSFATEKIRERGFTDGTTELYYNNYFEDIMDIELARSRRCDHEFSIVSIRINYMKDNMARENDAAFHNQVESIAGCLRQRLRRTDVLARTAIDEFMILLPETTSDGGSVVVENICQEIAAFVHPETIGSCQSEGNLPFDIGTATYPLNGVECPDLIVKARQYA